MALRDVRCAGEGSRGKENADHTGALSGIGQTATGQRRAPIEQAAAGVSTFLRGLAWVPLHPGALAALPVGRFDERLGVLLVGKDRAGRDRKVKLPPTTSASFLAQATGDIEI